MIDVLLKGSHLKTLGIEECKVVANDTAYDEIKK
jgi:hypothetical protein